MKKGNIFIAITIISFFSIWFGYVNNSMGMRHDADAGLQLDIIRENLNTIAKMTPEDARSYYEKALKELNALIKEYSDTEEALEAKYYMGVTYNEMGNFENAVKYIDEVLGYEDIDLNFKARSLYFKAKALLGQGEIEKAKGVIAELRVIEPRAANTFGKELSGTLRLDMKAPYFTAIDFNGNPVSLSQYEGDVIVLDFWATWSDYCIQEFPEVKKLYKRFKDQGVQFVGISLDDEIEDLRAFVQQNNIEWPQVFEGMRWKGQISKLYNIEKIPVMFVLDRNGKIHYIGADKGKITEVVTYLLSKSPQDMENHKKAN